MIAERSNEGSVDELLLVNIGNSRIAVASWRRGLRGEVSFVDAKDLERLWAVLDEQWQSLAGDAGSRRAVVVSSVSPPTLKRVRERLSQQQMLPVYVMGENLEPPISADLPEPAKVGVDRLCVAAAAYARVGGACVVADFGTALTVDLVADNGVFLGGTILPGVALSARALHEHTALLPLVEVGQPAEILGKDTVSAIRNGIYAGMKGALREITEQYATQIGKWPRLVVTGGDAEAIAAGCDFVDHVVPELCLDGMVIAWQQAQPDAE